MSDAGTARSRPLDAIFRPRSVAVVGASRRPLSIGREVIRNLVDGGFNGPVFPVNPAAEVVASMKAYPSVEAIPDAVDLAVIVVPRDVVLSVAEACARKGVRGLVVLTAGFREVGGEGAALERRLVEVVRGAGMRMIGPNCMGIIDTEPDVRLNASFAATPAVPGNVAFAAQSGALGEAILADARALGLGLATFVSMGNKADVSGNDLLEHWEDDPRVEVILLYLESFGNPRRFNVLARRITRRKPIIAVAAGRTRQGARAASSHTGSMVGRDAAVEALLEQCGVLRVGTIEEMFTLATAFARQPLPRGPRAAIVTNAGGPAVLATDVLVSRGLEMASLAPATDARLRQVLPAEASRDNPVDMIASATGERYHATLRAVLADPGVDAVIAIFVSPIMIDGLEIARAVADAASGSDKPVLVCFMGRVRSEEGVAELRRRGFPVYPFPEEPAQALASMHAHERRRSRPAGRLADLDAVEPSSAAAVLARAREEGREWLGVEEAQAVLCAYGLTVAPARLAASAVDAAAAAEALGFPVVVKAVSRRLVHKSDVGGVRLDLRDTTQVRDAVSDLDRRLRAVAPDLGFLVQRMEHGVAEVIVGMVRDETFGPLLLFGLGGIWVEVMQDWTARVHPLTDADAASMVRAMRGFPLLAGGRGRPAADLGALEEVLLRVDRLSGDCPAILEMDLNPVIAGTSGAVVVDARVRLTAASR